MGFNLEFLKIQRDVEYEEIKRLLRPGAKILEIGAGAGFQAKRFSDDGFLVEAIDMINSNYATDRVFPVQNYDGIHIPFEQGSFDFVFSSSVLEHVQNLPALQQDICRVLKTGGIAIHVVPSAVWRFWTIVSGYWEGMRELGLLAQGLFRTALSGQKANREELRNKWNWINEVYFFPKRHGELGNAYTEIYTFSRLYWVPMFKNQGFRIQEIIPAGLFYTGNMFLGKRLSIKARQFLAIIIGSACSIYLLTPQRSDQP